MQKMQLLNFATRSVSTLLRRESAAYPRYVAVIEPNRETIDFVKTTNARCIAEIGIYRGHTSMEFARYLNNSGELHLYDYTDRAKAVHDEIKRAGFNNVQTFGCSYKLLDSYNWPLAKQVEKHSEPIYDYVFIDGAHTFAVDALAFVLVDRLLKVGGHVDFDDYDWTLEISPALNPSVFPLTRRLYTPEQIKAQQVRMIMDLLVRRDPRYREVVPNKIFQKIA